jgi:hypothetical protein
MILAVLTAALAVPAQAQELEARKNPSLAAQAQMQASVTTPAYSQPAGWQARVSRNRGGNRSAGKSILLGALIGAGAGLVTGIVLEKGNCSQCPLGPVTALTTGVGAGAGAGIGWVVSLR